jgi:O-antigen/teichoic acid export membrane protein
MSSEEQGTPDALGSRIRSGLVWKAGSQILLQVSRMVVALVLARMLAPHDWGLAAMVLVFSAFVVVFTDSALGTALIQRRTLTEADKSTVFWLSAAIGVLLAIGGIALAGPIAHFYGEPEVKPLFSVLSLGFFVTAIGSTQLALLVRDMQFRRLELRQMAATVVGAVAGISVALANFGAWAVVAQQLGEAVASTVLLWIVTPWRPSATFSTTSVRRLAGFAGNVFGQNVLYQAGRNLGSILIGRVLGPASLGVFVLATNVILVPFSRIAGPLQQVFFPAFSRIADDRERMADIWVRAARLVGLISIPSLVGLACVAPDFVDVVLGQRWHSAIPVIRILAVVGIIMSVQTLNGEVLLALNRSGTLLRFTALWFVATIGSIAIGMHWGLLGAATCYAVATVLVEPVGAWLTTRALGISLWRFVGAFAGIVQATALMAVAVLAARSLLVAGGVPAVARLVLLVALGGVVYVLGSLWRSPEVVGEIKSVVRRRRPAPAPRAETLEARL